MPRYEGRPIPEGDDETTMVPTGYMQYKVDNATIVEQLSESQKALFALKSEPYIVPPLLTPEQKKIKWLQRKLRKQHGIDRKGRKIASSAKEALRQVQGQVNLGSADALRKTTHCEGQLFKQRIRMEGCTPKVIVNRFCHGTCSSYYVPKLRLRKLKMKPLFQSCSACQPSEYDTINVKLDCPRKPPGELTRRVVKVKKCSCIALDLDGPDEDDDDRPYV